MPRHRGLRLAAMALATTGMLIGASMPPGRQDPAQAGDTPGVEIQTRGPLHEAFAEPLTSGQQAPLVITKVPPEPIEERPPDQKPEGRDVRWIPGYWAWDDDRDDFLWISGLWRDFPPGRTWVPGYWSEVADGWVWTSGYWAANNAAGQIQYLPTPPESQENGPNSPAPGPGATWVPGNWVWQDNRYVWQPGTWITPPDQWTWVPPQYVSTPGGSIYNNGYWDYPLARRGLPFAPAYFSPGVYNRPNFAFTPGVALLVGALANSLFIRPNYGHYYFGDYYGPGYARSGFAPYFRGPGGRGGYDPIWAHQVATRRARDPQWEQRLREEYRRREERADLRPARTFHQGGRGANPAAGAAVAAPLADLAGRGGNGNGMRLQALDEAKRNEMARQAAEQHKAREQRKEAESRARKTAEARGGERRDLQPTRFDRPRDADPGPRPEPPKAASKKAAPNPARDEPAPRKAGRDEPAPKKAVRDEPTPKKAAPAQKAARDEPAPRREPRAEPRKAQRPAEPAPQPREQPRAARPNPEPAPQPHNPNPNPGMNKAGAAPKAAGNATPKAAGKKGGR